MFKNISLADARKPAVLFCIGWAVVILSLTASFQPVWNTFMHSWRFEFFASIFLVASLGYCLYQDREQGLPVGVSQNEFRFVVLPMCALICWSALSATWANSWK